MPRVPLLRSRLLSALEGMPDRYQAKDLPGLLRRHPEGVPGWEIKAAGLDSSQPADTDVGRAIAGGGMLSNDEVLRQAQELSPTRSLRTVRLGLDAEPGDHRIPIDSHPLLNSVSSQTRPADARPQYADYSPLVESPRQQASGAPWNYNEYVFLSPYVFAHPQDVRDRVLYLQKVLADLKEQFPNATTDFDELQTLPEGPDRTASEQMGFTHYLIREAQRTGSPHWHGRVSVPPEWATGSSSLPRSSWAITSRPLKSWQVQPFRPVRPTALSAVGELGFVGQGHVRTWGTPDALMLGEAQSDAANELHRWRKDGLKRRPDTPSYIAPLQGMDIQDLGVKVALAEAAKRGADYVEVPSGEYTAALLDSGEGGLAKEIGSHSKRNEQLASIMRREAGKLGMQEVGVGAPGDVLANPYASFAAPEGTHRGVPDSPDSGAPSIYEKVPGLGIDIPEVLSRWRMTDAARRKILEGGIGLGVGGAAYLGNREEESSPPDNIRMYRQILGR